MNTLYYDEFKQAFMKTAADDGYDVDFLRGFFKEAEEQYDNWDRLVRKVAEQQEFPALFCKRAFDELYFLATLDGTEKQAVLTGDSSGTPDAAGTAPAGGEQPGIGDWLQNIGRQVPGILDSVGSAFGAKPGEGGGLGGGIVGGGGGMILGMILSKLLGIPLHMGMLLGSLAGAGLGYGAGGTEAGRNFLTGTKPTQQGTSTARPESVTNPYTDPAAKRPAEAMTYDDRKPDVTPTSVTPTTVSPTPPPPVAPQAATVASANTLPSSPVIPPQTTPTATAVAPKLNPSN